MALVGQQATVWRQPMSVEAEAAVGLTSAEAEARRRRGEANTAAGPSRSYATILRRGVFSFYNVILFVIGIALLALGRYSDALISVGLGLVNAMISAGQEIRAKRKLDGLQLLDEAPVRVLRDGREVAVAPGAVVRGDVLLVRTGEQIVVDGPLLDGAVEADESLLTGESDPVVRGPGDDLRSGTVCVAGEGRQLARDVGAASYAGRLTADARRTTTDTTPLQRRIAFVVRLVMALTVLMSGAILAQAALEGFTLLRVVQTTAVLSGLVPYGLFFLIAVAYTVGAATIAGRGALVQQVNAVESVSHVDVVCTDKTGTLTTGHLTLDAVEPLGGRAAATVRAALGALARSATTPNLTTVALAAALPGTDTWTLRDEVPFASSLRWSGVRTDDGAWVLGAADVLGPHLRAPLPDDAVAERTGRGLRVLVLAHAADGACATPRAGPQLPDARRRRARRARRRAAAGGRGRARPVPRRRRGAEGALRRRPAHGRHPRDPGRARRGRAGGGGGARRARRRRAGPARRHHDGVRPGRAGAEGARSWRSLRRQGRYVAMIGDGVNDARALKGAQVGVAMRSGSPVTRDVADIVLVDNSFAALLPAQREGRKIINGIAISMYVFLSQGRHPGPRDHRGDDARARLPLLPDAGRADPAHRRRPDVLPHVLGQAHAARRAPAGQPRPLRHPGRAWSPPGSAPPCTRSSTGGSNAASAPVAPPRRWSATSRATPA